MLSHGYLTSIQAHIWDLKRQGSTQSAIAQQLEKSRQFIHKSLQQAEARITKAFLEVAKINHISIHGAVDTRHGIAFGYSERFQVEVAFTYSRRHGVQVWYKDDGNCATCRIEDQCRQATINLYEERNLSLPPTSNQLTPSQLADHLFSELRQLIEREEGD